MSGILGILHLDGAPIAPRLLQQLNNWHAFRGPDSQQTWVDGHIGLGHTLLNAQEEARHENQPFSLDGNVWIVADARVDRRHDLIAKLQSHGQGDLPAVTDIELILRAYQVWGENCVQHLLGDFTFGIWDGPRQRLFCARDQIGIKPFYYAHFGSLVVFSNTLDCVRQHPGVSDRLNDLAVADFLVLEMNQDPTSTTFADIQRLPPAHSATRLSETATGLAQGTAPSQLFCLAIHSMPEKRWDSLPTAAQRRTRSLWRRTGPRRCAPSRRSTGRSGPR